MRRIAIVPLLAGFLLTASVAQAKVVPRGIPQSGVQIHPDIVGGSPTAQGNLGFVVFVANPSYGECSGTLVSSNVVLTAAHCVVDENDGYNYPASDYNVYYGNVDRTQAQTASVSQIDVASGYIWDSSADYDDAALLVLSSSVSQPTVSLAVNGFAPPLGTLIAGWGLTIGSDSASAPTVLQWASTTTQLASYCAYHFAYFSSSLQLCALNILSYTSVCNGDSGGPLMYYYNNQWVELGITDFGIADCNVLYPQYFTNVEVSFAEDAGHFVHYECPDLAAREINKFFSGPAQRQA